MRIGILLLALCLVVGSSPATAQPGPRLPTGFIGYPSDSAMKFQVDLSLWVLSTSARESGVYAAYGQRSFWDLDNDARPFRVENNFRPEVGAVWGPDAGRSLTPHWPSRLALSAAFIHESNGLELESSRGWNRIVGGVHVGTDECPIRAAILGWYAFRVEDTNADITRDAGDGEVRLVADLSRMVDGMALRVRSAFSPDARSGLFFTNLEAGLYLWPGFLPSWLFPGTDGPPIDFVVEWFVGTGEYLYGHSMHENRLGIGITLHPGSVFGS